MVAPLTADPERRRRLLAAKLRALLRTGWPEEAPGDPAAGGGGVSLEAGGRGWVLLDDGDGDLLHGFARALLWGLHRGVQELHVLAADHSDLVAAARQAACFALTATVWAVDGTSLRRVEPVPLPDEPPLDPQAARFREVIAAGGAEPVVEWGQLTGEVLGLPVARACTDEAGAWLEVGVGKHDRLANRMMWGDEPPAEAVAAVVVPVLDARRSGDLGHPLNQLCRERWLRVVLRRDPAMAGLAGLDPVGPPRPVGDLKVPLVAPALAHRHDGTAVLVGCSVGFDPTFVPSAAELHAARAPELPLLLVVPEGDDHPLTRRAASALRAVAEVRTVPKDWHQPARLAGRDLGQPTP